MNKKKVLTIVIGILVVMMQACSTQPSTPTITNPTDTITPLPPTFVPTETPAPTNTSASTDSPIPTPISVPLMWKQINTGQDFARDEITAIVQDPKDENILYLGTRNSGVYKSVDRGSIWQPASTGLDTASIVSLAFNPSDPQNLYVKTESRNYRTDNAGENWGPADNFPYINPKPNELHMPGECTVLAINPDDNATAYCGLERGIFLTKDRGENWELVNANIGWVKAILISPYDPKVVFAGGKGFAISKDSGHTWEQQNNGLGAVFFELEAHPTDKTKLYVHFIRDSVNESVWSVYRSKDSGHSWKVFNGGYGIWGGYRMPVQGGNFFINAEGTMYKHIDWHVWRSYDEGNTWRLFRRLSHGPNHVINHPKNPSNIYILAPDFMELSLDGGKTWIQSSLSIGGNHPRLYFSNDINWVYAASDTNMAFSTDMGEHWSLCAMASEQFPESESKVAINPTNAQKFYAATVGRGIIMSDDGCKSWQRSNKGLGNLFINTIVIDPNQPDTIYAGTDSGAYISFDSGVTWSQINDGLLDMTVIYSIAVDKDGDVYATTPNGIYQLVHK